MCVIIKDRKPQRLVGDGKDAELGLLFMTA